MFLLRYLGNRVWGIDKSLISLCIHTNSLIFILMILVNTNIQYSAHYVNINLMKLHHLEVKNYNNCLTDSSKNEDNTGCDFLYNENLSQFIQNLLLSNIKSTRVYCILKLNHTTNLLYLLISFLPWKLWKGILILTFLNL